MFGRQFRGTLTRKIYWQFPEGGLAVALCTKENTCMFDRKRVERLFELQRELRGFNEEAEVYEGQSSVSRDGEILSVRSHVTAALRRIRHFVDKIRGLRPFQRILLEFHRVKLNFLPELKFEKNLARLTNDELSS